jgi:hypothetical protein
MTELIVEDRQACSAVIVPARGRRAGQLIAILLVIAAGVAIRTIHLDTLPFWVDEAESSINALTILQHGYPTESYLDIPIYENTHVWFWPENPEYEFRDVSYSDKNVAVYHGWLPLYAIAASFALHGIQPDADDGSRSTKHDLSEQKRRTRAARLPAVLFAAIFLAVVFIGGKVLLGYEAGWAALLVGAFYPTHLQVSNHARYYSAQVTLTTACCILLWLVIRTCKWKHVLLAAVTYVLLFHTHLLSFLTAAVMAAVSMPVIVYRHKDWLRKMAAFSAVVAAGTLPWIVGTGFYNHQNRIPRAWPLLHWSDMLRYQPFNLWYVVAGLVFLLIVLWLKRTGRRESCVVSTSARQLGPVLIFLGAWAAIGYAAFLLCIPAVSFTQSRLNLSYWGPLYLLFATVCATVVRIVAPRASRRFAAIFTADLMLVVFLLAAHHPVAANPFSVWDGIRTWDELTVGPRPGDSDWNTYGDIFHQLDAMRLDPGTKLYAAPSRHLVLTFYSGLPIQDITPVRKSYLDSYRGEIVYMDLGVTGDTGMFAPWRIQEAAAGSGNALSAQAAEEASVLLRTRSYRETMAQALAPGLPAGLEPVPPFAEALMTAHRARVESDFANFGYELVTRGFEILNWSDWVAVLKYRFVDPNARRGIHANYVQRLRGSDAMILSTTEPVAIYRSRWHPPVSTAPLHFRYVR